MLHRDLDRHTASLVLLSGLRLNSESSARSRVRAKAALGPSCFLGSSVVGNGLPPGLVPDHTS